MNKTLTVHPLDTVARDGWVERGALLEHPDRESRTLWFRAPEAHGSCFSTLSDPFLIAVLIHVMRNGWDVRVRGPVSASLLRNLHEFQTAWSRWMPDRYRAVDLAADERAPEAGARSRRTLTAFSGGLDSCFAVWRQVRKAPPAARHALDSGLMVRGFDIPLEEPYAEVFDRAAEKSRRILESVGISLITVTTNLRTLGDDWLDSHGAAVAAGLHAMGGAHGTGLIPGTHAYEALRLPFGSNPLTDPLLSSERMGIVYDSPGYSRVEKALGVADWPEAMRDMRVCWEGAQLDRNCGVCMKCVAFAICYAVNELPIPPCMPIRDLAEAIRGIMHIPLPPYGVIRMKERLALVRQRGLRAPWIPAAVEWMRRSERAHRSARTTLLRSARRALSGLAASGLRRFRNR